ncbi:hypothetical protein [Bacteroides caecigallinarum]|uniref:hypothetical protein n=1 Tax=Bacteroides caecigallinarum TaxID=1411144 RepID=UPI00195ABBA1|nr:hypothetical protein [Bacteroides caecigallinarum]MBM6883995.1 hypothetical protein [Bacteroides caecigallinarum]
MIDLEQMMNSVSLTECKKEIEKQFASVAKHDNKMKRAVLLCLFGEVIISEIAKEDPDMFIEELREYLNKIISEENTENYRKLMLHVKENEEIVRNIDTISDNLRDISSKVAGLMADFDNQLTEIIRTRDKLSVGKL